VQAAGKQFNLLHCASTLDSYASEHRRTRENADEHQEANLGTKPAPANTGERLQTGRHIHGVQVVARSNRAGPTSKARLLTRRAGFVILSCYAVA